MTVQKNLEKLSSIITDVYTIEITHNTNTVNDIKE